MTDADVPKAVCRGFACNPRRLRVLYNDGARFLVAFPGGYFGREPLRSWTHGWVDLYLAADVNPKDTWGWHGKEVWNGLDNGRLTRKRLASLVLSLGLDPECVRVAKPKA